MGCVPCSWCFYLAFCGVQHAYGPFWSFPVSNLRSLAVHEVLRGFEQGQVGAFLAPFGGLL